MKEEKLSTPPPALHGPVSTVASLDEEDVVRQWRRTRPESTT